MTPPSFVSSHIGQLHLKNSSGSKFSVLARMSSADGRSRCTNVKRPLRDTTALFPYMKKISSSESMFRNVGENRQGGNSITWRRIIRNCRLEVSDFLTWQMKKLAICDFQ